ncbi:hypothetical protein ACU686_13590 [Yinghuangia aomiensis]
MAYRYYTSNHFLAELICNLEVLSANRPPMYARLIVTRHRTRVHISFEARKVPAVVTTGVTIEHITLQLQQDFGIRGRHDRRGRPMDGRAAHGDPRGVQPHPAVGSRLSAQPRTAAPQAARHGRLGRHQDGGQLQRSTHTLTVLDHCFQDLKAFVGGGLDAIPYTHMTILHEIGHSLEVWFQTDKIPNAERIKALEAEVARIRKRMAELGELLNDKRLTGAKRDEVQADYDALARQLPDVEVTCALTIARSLHGNGCLTAFILKVQELGLQPITRYSWGEWPAKPYEFWAECYSIFLVDPAALEYVSPPLYPVVPLRPLPDRRTGGAAGRRRAGGPDRTSDRRDPRRADCPGRLLLRTGESGWPVARFHRQAASPI